MPTIRLSRWNSIATAILVIIIVAVVFGGASRQHEFRLAIVELTALPLLVLGLSSLTKQGAFFEHRFALFLLACIALMPLIQLVPLPPAIWTSLPGRDEPALALELSGAHEGWLPLSFTPDRTWRSFLALIPPSAMFVAVLVVEPAYRLRTVIGLLAAIVVAILLGAAQFVSSSDYLYMWTTTLRGSVVGFFANRNHMATLCLIGLPFAAVLGAGAMRRSGSGARLLTWVSVLYVVLAIVAIGVIRSRAGVILFGPILVGTLLATWVASGRGRPKPLLLGLASGAAIAVAAVGAFAIGPIVARFDSQGAAEGRFENWPIVFKAAESYLPLGSGFGSFDTVYRSVEPLDRLDPTFFNQAHNDYLETLLEAGWLGAGIIIAFMIWYCRRSWTAWRARVSTQRDLQRAASVAILAVLLHSAADYPIRTATIATIFALCCGLLELAGRSDVALEPQTSARRRRSRSTL